VDILLKDFAEADADDLIAFQSADEWPYHGNPNPTQDDTAARIERRAFSGDDNAAFWIVAEDDSLVGFVHVFDLMDPSCLFDMKIGGQFRRQGIGFRALQLLAQTIFERYPKVIRIEGNTRRDNLPMRRLFEKSAFVAESAYRQAWPSRDGSLHDAFGYALLRADWETGTTTAVDWS